MKRKPRFYCDNCENEVGDDVKVCPFCGRNFISIRCPNCSYSGPDRMFQNGCPMCGYSAAPSKPPKYTMLKPPRAKTRPPSEPIPFWSYITVFITLFLLIAFLSYFITR